MRLKDYIVIITIIACTAITMPQLLLLFLLLILITKVYNIERNISDRFINRKKNKTQ